jgi:hypothetical protein
MMTKSASSAAYYGRVYLLYFPSGDNGEKSVIYGVNIRFLIGGFDYCIFYIQISNKI